MIASCGLSGRCVAMCTVPFEPVWTVCMQVRVLIKVEVELEKV